MLAAAATKAMVATAAEPELPFLHLKCRLCFMTMPMGNRLPMRNALEKLPAVAAAAAAAQIDEEGGEPVDTGAEAPAATTVIAAANNKFVDAHTIKGISIEKAMAEIARASPESMEMGELMLRRQIATSVLITMGRKMTHFEGDIDPLTGAIDIDFKFTPHINNEQHLAPTLGK